MISEKQSQFRERRFLAGLNNPKKDAWARRGRPMSKPKRDERSNSFGDLSSDLLKIGFFENIWLWITSLFSRG